MKRGCGGAVCGCGVSDGVCVVVKVKRGGYVKQVLLWVLIVVHPLPWCQWWQWKRVSVSVVVDCVVMVAGVVAVGAVGSPWLGHRQML